MPQIFDNIELKLQEGLSRILQASVSASFCIGYLNLRGWDQLADLIEHLEGGEETRCCRLLVGMHRPPEEEMRRLAGLQPERDVLDGATLVRLKRRITESFKQQLEFGIPTDRAERSLRRLADQIRARKVILKAFLRYPLHAKLYLVRRSDPATPLIGFVGSSNLTLAGLSHQGELNVDVVEQDAAQKLQKWFDERWQDELALDLSDLLADLIEKSWARSTPVRPFHVYLKIAYHLSEDAREGEREFKLPKVFQNVLLDFQAAAVSLAARRLYRYGGVLLGDVVGLGKTLMAAAVARIFQEDDDSDTLVICPPNLCAMWERCLQDYQITHRVLSIGMVDKELPALRRYRLVVIDESHNLRNREGKRYKAIQNYIEVNEARVMLLTATPYNKQYLDLSNQLRLFVKEDQPLHLRPEQFFKQWAAGGKNEADFLAAYQTAPDSLRAFEKSPFPEDWRDLMRLFLVRRTRQFIIRTYAEYDAERGRHFVFLNGTPFYFPRRQPRTVTFDVKEDDPNDPYARLLREEVVEVIENLRLPRYGMAGYLVPNAEQAAQGDELRILENLNRAGRRLIGFCRTNLFKRLESVGSSFLLSIERHIVRNLVTLHALEHGLSVPIGTQDAARLDPAVEDKDEDAIDQQENDAPLAAAADDSECSMEFYRRRAERIYRRFAGPLYNRFDWLDAEFFRPDLAEALRHDAEALLALLDRAERWDASRDAKLAALEQLLGHDHRGDKVIVFTQFADTADYLGEQLARRGFRDSAVVTSRTDDPVTLARRFSPHSNGGLRPGESELRLLIATDVLAEGQNLQNAHVIVNYDLPWAIIRLIQRAGRVDRIGQQHDTITVCSFLPSEGVERIIKLRQRLFQRLQENREVVGSDESFFGEEAADKLRDLYTEKSGVLDDDAADEDIDLASAALQVWNSASPEDQKAAVDLPPIIAAARELPEDAVSPQNPPGAAAYLRYPDGSDALVRVDEQGRLVSQSFSAVFAALACPPETPAQPRPEGHNRLVSRCVEIAAEEQHAGGGQLGSLRSVRRKLWERLNRFGDSLKNLHDPLARETLNNLQVVLDLIWRHPLKRAAQEAVSRQMRLGITDSELLDLLLRRMQDDNLCQISDEIESGGNEPQLICSMGLIRRKLP